MDCRSFKASARRLVTANSGTRLSQRRVRTLSELTASATALGLVERHQEGRPQQGLLAKGRPAVPGSGARPGRDAGCKAELRPVSQAFRTRRRQDHRGHHSELCRPRRGRHQALHAGSRECEDLHDRPRPRAEVLVRLVDVLARPGLWRKRLWLTGIRPVRPRTAGAAKLFELVSFGSDLCCTIFSGDV
jgi:hypothetical protein